MDKNREFAELVGLCWHEKEYYPLSGPTLQCDKCKEFIGSFDFNPDYVADPRLVLREMMTKLTTPEFQRFVWRVGYVRMGMNYGEVRYQIELDLILDTTGKLVKEAIEFRKEGT
ncbi:MAG: hypothetical protein ABIE47_16845 [Pseudomonadota bacterium]